jgi:hypothetical protein
MMPMPSEAALALNHLDVASQPKCRETMTINYLLDLPSSGSFNFFLNLPTLRPFYPPTGSLVSVGLPWAGSQMPA